MFQKISDSKFTYVCFGAFLLGNGVFGTTKSMQALLTTLGLLVIFFIWKKLSIVRIVFICVVIVAGFAMFYLEYDVRTKHELTEYIATEKEVHLVVEIVDESIVGDNALRTRAKVLSVEGSSVKNHTELLLYSELFDPYTFGDHIEMHATIESIPVFEDFDYGEFMLKDYVVGAVYRPEIISITPSLSTKPKNVILNLKNNIVSFLNKNIPEPESAFIAGLLIGDRNGFSKELEDAFARTGMTHVVAISGYNISLVIVIVGTMSKYIISRKYYIWMICLLLICFVVLTGASASVVRAGLMGGILLLAKHVSRTGSGMRILVLTAVCMVIVNPFVLVWDVAFQLSFASTAGILVFSERVEKYFMWVPEFAGIRESLVLTLVAFFATLPISIWSFGGVSLVSLLANMLAAPLLPLAMLFGALGLLALPIPVISSIFLFICFYLLRIILEMVRVLSQFEFAYFHISHTPRIVICVVWLLVLSIIFYNVYAKKHYRHHFSARRTH